MNYSETIQYLFQKLPIYQRSGKMAYKKDIGNIIKSSEILKNPHLNFKSVHIAGTNGKGSTSHIISSILQESGYKVGLYTSPHLKDFRERIKINGELISKDSVIDFIDSYKSEFEKINMSFFEMTVIMAFKYFEQEKVDIAIIEAGLGGRLDSTNIIRPLLSIITNISIDHTSILGNTIEKIAKEKAGIIKKEVPVIIGRQQAECENIFINKAKKLNSEITFCNTKYRYATDLLGNYQNENIATSVKAIEKLNQYGFSISEKNITHGLMNVKKNTSIQGRWQIIEENPLVICDIAHNEDGIKQIICQLKNLNYEKLHFIIGMVNDKETDKILSLLPKDASYYFCEADIIRSLKKEDLYEKANHHQLSGNIFSSVKQAFLSAKKNSNKKDCIFIGGSTFIVSEII